MADVATPKPPPPPQAIEPGTVFVKNPGGVIHDILEGTNPAIELAQKGENGWRLASDDEIRAYCKLNNLQLLAEKAAVAAGPRPWRRPRSKWPTPR